MVYTVYIYTKRAVSFLTYEDEQDPDSDLQTEGDADQGDDGGVKGEVWPLLQHGLELGGIGHQQSHIQHALSCALLISIVVYIQRGQAAGPNIWMRGLGGEKKVT